MKTEIPKFRTWTKTYTLPGTHVFGMPALDKDSFELINSLNGTEFKVFVGVGMITLKALLPNNK